MKEHNEFDELARRKLEERDHAFQDAHWADMEKLIDADRKKRRGGYWLVPILLLLLGGGAWIFNSNKNEEITNTEVASIQKVKNEAGNNRADGIERYNASEDPIEADQAQPGPLKEIHPSKETRKVEGNESRIGSSTPPDEIRTINAAPEVHTEPIATIDRMEPSEVRSTLIPTDPIEADRPVELDHGSIEIASVVPDPIEKDPVAEQDRTDEIATVRSSAVQPDLSDEKFQQPEIIPNEVDRTIDDAGASSHATDAMIPGDTLHTDLPNDPIAVVNDSAATLTPEPTPILDPRSPFELGIFGGTTFTTSAYTGPLSQDWNSTIEPQQTFTGGVEVMRMGRNFGIGSGLHYSTYAERIISEQIDRSETAEHHYYFLSPVDTTLLIITDSIFVSGEWHYTGQSIYTTVHVLDEGYETITTNTRVRDARDQVNRTSYLEIPLLLDAHLTQGRWSLGLRGGPTLGVLTMHRGSVPRTDAGYLNLADQDLRTLVFGYTARAYVRHRFNAGWSIGLEPMIGGHLVNSFANADLMRRPSAFGGMLSLTYRIK